MSPTVYRAIQRSRGFATGVWLRPDGSLRRLAAQETFWRCAAHLVAHLRAGVPLPSAVRGGREEFEVAMDEEAWRQLRQELDLDSPGAQAAFCHALRCSLGRENGGGADGPLPKAALGLLLLTLHLLHLNPEANDAFRLQFREFTVAARRHLRGATPPSFDEHALREPVFDLAGVNLAQAEKVFELPWRAYFLPLQSLLGPEKLTPPARSAQTLPVNFLTQAMSRPAPVAAVPGDQEGNLRRRLEMLMEENQKLRELDGRGPLSVLLDPILRMAGDPLASLEAERTAELPPLGAELVTACTRMLRHHELSLFGEPGTILKLKLPDPEYELDAAAPRLPGDAGRLSFQVVRRGVRLRGTLFLPARVISTLSSPV